MTRPDEIAALADELDACARNPGRDSTECAVDGELLRRVAAALRASATSPGDAVRDIVIAAADELYTAFVNHAKTAYQNECIAEYADARNSLTALAPAEKAGDDLPLYSREREIISNESYDIGWRDGYEEAVGGQPRNTLSDDQIKYMVDRFLSWKLPRDAFNPDCGISFDKEPFNKHTAHPMLHEPMGTNLFDATQADAMVRHMIDELPTATPTPPSGSELRREAKETSEWILGYLTDECALDLNGCVSASDRSNVENAIINCILHIQSAAHGGGTKGGGA